MRTLRIWTLGVLVGAYITATWLIGEAERHLFAELAHHKRGH